MNDHRPHRGSAQLRRALVEELDRRRPGIRSDAVRDAFLAVPRELFVAELAAAEGLEAVYRNQPLVTRKDTRGAPVSSSSQPGVMVSMLDELDLRPGLRVLEVGAGTGYNAALIATIVGSGGRVVSVDIDREIAATARRALRTGGYKARVLARDGRDGWPSGAPYDRIMITASSLEVPPALCDQLTGDGLLELPLRFSQSRHGQQAIVVLRRSDSGLDSVNVFPGAFMGLRDRPDCAAPAPGAYLGATETIERTWRGHTSLEGAPLKRLGRLGRRRLLGVALQDPEVTALGLRAPAYALRLFVSLALPESVVVEGRYDRGAGIGVVDVEGSGLTMLAGTWRHITRIERYGKAPAATPLLEAVEDWVALGRPGLDDLRINVRYGRGRRRHGAWRAVRCGRSLMSFDWAQRAP